MAYSPNNSLVSSEEDVNNKHTNNGVGWSGSVWTGQLENPRKDYIRSSIKANVNSQAFAEFSNDGITIDSTFPVAGFSLSTFHEYHGADLGGRFFRIRVVFDSLPTEVSINTYYSNNPPTLNSPLSQGVSTDQDATTVKAVAHGEDRSNAGTFIQQKFTADGAAIVSTDSSIINFAYDSYTKTFVSSTKDRFDYYQGGLTGTKVAEILITYEDASKINTVSAERTNL